MADDLEEEPSTYQASSKSPIYDTLNKIKQWQKEQLQQFRNRQYLENQNAINLHQNNELLGVLENTSKSAGSEGSERNLTSENSNASSVSLRNDFENFGILQESSITGHMQRCFDDSSRSSLSVIGSKIDVSGKNENFKEIPTCTMVAARSICEIPKQQMTDNGDNSSSHKTKRPFLRKGSGLLRYMPKSSVNSRPAKCKKPLKTNNTQNKNPCLPQKTLHLKPALRKTGVPSEKVKHIKFDVPPISSDESKEDENNCNIEQNSEFNNNIEAKSKCSSMFSSSLDHRFDESNESSPESGGLNLSNENKELEIFEALESCAQNSSFNSDSSVVQRLLLGDSPKPVPVADKNLPKPNLKCNTQTSLKEIDRNPSENSIFSPKFGLSKCLEEVHARKELIQKQISEINPKIQALSKEVARSQKEMNDDSDASDRCSTPISDINIEDRPILPSQEMVSDIDPPVFCVSPPLDVPYDSGDGVKEILEISDQSCSINDCLGLYPDNDNLQKDDSIVEEPFVMDKSDQVSNERNLLRNKRQELEKEIEIYQEMNAKLSSVYKERNEFLKKLQKERDDFNKYKEAEKKKLEAEMEEERRQIKRQKETFTRYQKLRRDNPTRKERDEMNSLRQENEKLQEEIKRQKIKYNSDSRRWKNQLETAERERDNFKLENIKLEEQCQDLLVALKTRMKKKPDAKSCDKTEENDIDRTNQNKELVKMKDAESQTDKINFKSDSSKNGTQISPKGLAVKKTKSKVHFNLYSEFQKKELETVVEETENKTRDELLGDNFVTKVRSEVPSNHHNNDDDVEKNPEVNLSTISESVGSFEIKIINHGNKIERIYTSGEREVEFNSGTRKIISLDGKVTFLFYNGDTKEIFPDKREVYRYENGTTETIHPDGLKVTEFPSGEIQRQYPDGRHEIKYSDGTIKNTLADGSEVIKLVDGNMVKLAADGTKITEFVNGQKEIRTATYMRREFPNGAVKIIYDTGRQETRYPDGRIRIKDKKGKVLYDTKYLAKKD